MSETLCWLLKKLDPRTLKIASAHDFLDTWGAFLGLNSSLTRAENPPEEAVEGRDRLEALLDARTSEAQAMGVTLPFAEFARANGLDRTDRLVLLALLLDALSPKSRGGLTLAEIADACGAVGSEAIQSIRERLETEGALRDLNVVECDQDLPRLKRLYRVAPRFVGPLGTEGGSIAKPKLERGNWIEAITRLAGAARRLSEVSATQPELPLWAPPRRRGPGWDPQEEGRRELLETMEAIARDVTTPLGKVLREGRFSRAESLILGMLVRSEYSFERGEAAAGLLDAAGIEKASAETAETYLGAGSRLRTEGLIEDCTPTLPALRKRVRLTEAARAKLLPFLASDVSGPQTEAHSAATWDEGTSSTSLADVVLAPEVREALLDALAFEKLADRSGPGRVVDGAAGGGRRTVLLLYGPPGTGKTHTARAIAGELTRGLCQLRLDQVVSKWAGEAEKGLVRAFRHAQERRQVLLLDEADSLLAERDSQLEWQVPLTNQLLQEIERFEGVLVLTTNRVDSLDPALDRRVTFRLELQPPDEAMRVALWQLHRPARFGLAPDVDLQRLAREFELTGSGIASAYDFALRKAVRRGEPEPVIRMADLESAARSRVMPFRSRRVLGFGPSTLGASMPAPRVTPATAERGTKAARA